MNTLFICSANVGRSQMAEGYYNHLSKENVSKSAALFEDKVKKYNGKPDPDVCDAMNEDGVDIASQTINLLTKDVCDKADRIILLLDPYEEKESEYLIDDSIKPVDFLLDNYSEKIIIKKVQDPYGEGIEKMIKIRDEIKKIITDEIFLESGSKI